MSKFIDLTGKTFGRLTVVERAENDKWNKTQWKCKCSCGNINIVLGHSLRCGDTKSCGCLRTEILAKGNFVHGMVYSPEYNTWEKMIQRCRNPNNQAFKYYGGRGIEVCQEWKDSFLVFYNHVGKRPSPKHSIDRIDNDGNYEPGNVKWSLRVEQANNKQNNRNITINGKTMSLFQWAHFVGMSPHTLYGRISRNWPPEKAVFCPIKKR